MTWFGQQAYLAFFKKVDIVTIQGYFSHLQKKMYQLNFLIQQSTSGGNFLFKQDNGQKAQCSCKGTGYCQFPFRMLLCLFFYKYCIRKKQLIFCHKVLVVSLWKVSAGKKKFRNFFPHEFTWKKAVVGFTEVLLFQKALLASSSI